MIQSLRLTVGIWVVGSEGLYAARITVKKSACIEICSDVCFDVSFSLRNFSLFAHATTFLAKTVLGLVFQTVVNKPRFLLRVICFLEIR